MLRKNYDIQIQTNQGLREEMRQKDDQFKNKMNLLETELKSFMQQSRGMNQEEVSKVRDQYEQKLLQLKDELKDKDQ